MEAWNIGGYATSFVLVATSLILLYLYLAWKCRYWQRLGIKSPTLFETIVNLPRTFSQPFHVSLAEAYNKYGRVFGVYSPLPQLFVAEPELLKQILVKDFHIFRNRMKIDFNQELLQKMLSILENEDWKRVRCVMSPTFSSSKMRRMAILVNECANNTAKFFEEISNKNKEVDIKPYFGSFAVDVIATTAFATKMNSLHDPDNEFLANARKMINRDVSFIKIFFVTVFPRIAKLLRIEMFDVKPLMYFRGIVMEIIEERQKTKMRGYDFLQLMTDSRDGIIEAPAEEESKEAEEQQPHIEERPKHKTISFEEIVSQCVLFFSAGHDTTSTTLSYVAYNLALNPDCQDRLAKEIQETWEKYGAMDFDIVSKMQYLDAVFSETLRKDSPATILFRVCSEDYALGNTGVTLPKGSTVTIPVHSMHNDPEWFPNPDKFDPERFMPENKHLIKPFTYLPFGEGPRNCIGMRFVLMVMKLCLSYLLKDIKFVATEETRKPLEYYSTQGLLAKRIPLKVEKRKVD